MVKTFTSLNDARAEALRISIAHPTLYVTIGSCFGWIVSTSKRLNVFAPSDYADPFGRTGTYWLKGVEKRFTEKQRIADQNATPMMS